MQPTVHEQDPTAESFPGNAAQKELASHSSAAESTLETPVNTDARDRREDHPAESHHAQTHPMLLNDAASAWLGLEVVDFGPGHATCRMTLRPEMLNGFGIGHGGMVFALADSAFAIACNDAADESAMTLAQGVDINFLAPAQPGMVLTATATMRASTGRSGICDVTVTQESRPRGADLTTETVTIAEFRGRSRTVPRRSPGAAAPSPLTSTTAAIPEGN